MPPATLHPLWSSQGPFLPCDGPRRSLQSKCPWTSWFTKCWAPLPFMAHPKHGSYLQHYRSSAWTVHLCSPTPLSSLGQEGDNSSHYKDTQVASKSGQGSNSAVIMACHSLGSMLPPETWDFFKSRYKMITSYLLLLLFCRPPRNTKADWHSSNFYTEMWMPQTWFWKEIISWKSYQKMHSFLIFSSMYSCFYGLQHHILVPGIILTLILCTHHRSPQYLVMLFIVTQEPCAIWLWRKKRKSTTIAVDGGLLFSDEC